MRSGVVEAVESALHLCVLLSAVPGGILPAVALAEFHELPLAGTAKILQDLAAAGVVEAQPGRKGGYALARPANEISVAEVVAAAGERGRGMRCKEIRRNGPCTGPSATYSVRCAVASMMDTAEQAWWDALRTRTLADLASQIGAQVDAPTLKRSASWLKQRSRTL